MRYIATPPALMFKGAWLAGAALLRVEEVAHFFGWSYSLSITRLEVSVLGYNGIGPGEDGEPQLIVYDLP